MQKSHRSSSRVLHLCPERIPRFGRQSKADRSLAETMATLNKQLLQGPLRARETPKEALTRMGFVLRDRYD